MSTAAVVEATLTHPEASALETKIVKGIEELESNLTRFIEGRGWEPLGFGTFLRWWDDRVVSARLGPALRAVVVKELSTADPESGRELTSNEVGERVGVTGQAIRKLRKDHLAQQVALLDLPCAAPGETDTVIPDLMQRRCDLSPKDPRFVLSRCELVEVS